MSRKPHPRLAVSRSTGVGLPKHHEEYTFATSGRVLRAQLAPEGLNVLPIWSIWFTKLREAAMDLVLALIISAVFLVASSD